MQSAMYQFVFAMLGLIFISPDCLSMTRIPSVSVAALMFGNGRYHARFSLFKQICNVAKRHKAQLAAYSLLHSTDSRIAEHITEDLPEVRD